jgi:hypothetical protein
MNPDMNGWRNKEDDETKAKGCHTFVDTKKCGISPCSLFFTVPRTKPDPHCFSTKSKEMDKKCFCIFSKLNGNLRKKLCLDTIYIIAYSRDIYFPFLS